MSGRHCPKCHAAPGVRCRMPDCGALDFTLGAETALEVPVPQAPVPVGFFGPAAKLAQAHARLAEAFRTVADTASYLGEASTDTAFAVGEALGAISKAKALLGRDIDQARGGGA